jgi:hypothetical protein
MPRIKIRFKNGKAEEYDHKEYDMPDEIPLTATNFSITNRNVTIFSMDTIEKIEIVGFPKKTLHNFTE